MRNTTIAVVDRGLFANLAIRLAPYFKRVLYNISVESAAPKSSIDCIGEGFENVEVIDNIWDHIDEIDLFVFPDVYDGALQEYLKKIGKPVWGSGKLERWETDRWYFKKFLQKLGLPFVDGIHIKGMDALIDILKETNNKVVKTSKYRGDFETLQHKDWKLTEPLLDDLEHNLGARKYKFEFIVEELEDSIAEIGYDGYIVKGEFPSIACWGLEVKGSSYLGKVTNYNELPESLKVINDTLAPHMKNMTGFFSTEVLIQPKTAFLIDPCMRMGQPPGESYMELFENLPEIIFAGAQGDLIEPEVKYKYFGQVVLQSEWSLKHWNPITVPKELEKWLKLVYPTKINNQPYVVPEVGQTSVVGWMVALGNSPQEVIDTLKDRVKQVEGIGIESPTDSLDEALNRLKKLEAVGIKF